MVRALSGLYLDAEVGRTGNNKGFGEILYEAMQSTALLRSLLNVSEHDGGDQAPQACLARSVIAWR